MAQIDQIQITFVPDEDRLLLRLSTQDNDEFRFWLTRRLVKALGPVLSQSLARQPRIQTQSTPLAQRELLKFEHERVVQASDFKTPYRAAEKRLPLGQQPIIVTRAQIKPGAGGVVGLTLAPSSGQGIDLALTPPLLHSFVALLEHALAAAEWDLAPALAVEPPAVDGPVSIN